MSPGHWDDEENKRQGLQAFGGKCLFGFRARKMAFFVELGDSKQTVVFLSWFPGN